MSTGTLRTDQKMKKEKTIYLVDGTAYIYRAFHAIRSLSNSKGLPTNAIFGFTNMIKKLLDDHTPEYVAIFFDAKGPTFRHDMYSDYKANRPPMPEDLQVQIPYIKEVTRGFNLPVLEMQGFEADDLIGTVTRAAEKDGFHVVIVTGDKDFKQLVTEKTTIWDPNPRKEKTTDINSLREDMGVVPEKIIDVMGLSGDAADNVPGIPGIGPKTALSLIKTYGSIEQLYEQIETLTAKKQKENLLTYKDQAFLSRSLVTINTDVPILFDLETFKAGEADRDALSGLFKTLEFRQLQKDFPKETDLSKKDYKVILDRPSLDELVSRLGKAGIFSIDTETTSENPRDAKLVGLSFSLEPDKACYIPCGHSYPDAPDQLDCSEILEALRPILLDPEIKKIGQNIKYDWIVLLRHGADLNGIAFDTMVASYLLNPTKRSHSLDRIALDYLDHKTITYQEVAGTGKNAKNFTQVPLEAAIPYACEDADITFMARNVLAPKLKELGLDDLMEKVEMLLVPVLMRMETCGVSVNVQKLRDLSETFESQLEELERRIHHLAGEEFNIKSSQQLGKILFEKLGLPVQKKTKKKTGYSTDVDVLTILSEKHELPVLVLRHRTLAKLKSTYTDALIELVNPETGRIHTSYNQTVTATGRLSSSAPNLQNIPIRTEEGKEIREAFVPRKDCLLVSADYSQVELRVLAHCSEDEILIKAFMEDEDIHTRTATEVFQVFPSFVTPDLRRQAKAINFGIIYGMSAFGLSKQLGISRKMAQTYIDHYFTTYKGVKHFMDTTIEKARETQRTETLLGRIRSLPEISSSNRNVRQFAERTAINTPIQGTAADLLKVAMINADRVLREKALQTAMILTVHDELVFEVPPDELDTVKTLIRDVMEGVWELSVPLKVNMAEGKNWAEAH